jgi:hypothetical protein
MSSAAADNRWKKVPKARRAAVYRAIGRASREAREANQKETAADVRVAMDVLRAHAKSAARRRPR